MLVAIVFASTGAGDGYILVPVIIIGFILWSIMSHYGMTPEQRQEYNDRESMARDHKKAYRDLTKKKDINK